MKTLSGKEVSKIGIGSYGVGGRGHRDIAITDKFEDDRYIDSLAYALSLGFNFTEIALGYAHGLGLTLFKKALEKSGVARQDIFLTHSLYPRDLPSLEVIRDDIESFHNIMQTDYVDSTLVTQTLLLKFGKEEIYSLLHKLLDNKKTRYVSLSNANPDWINDFKMEFKEKFVAHEGHLSFEVRALQDKGVFAICDDLGINNIIWRPLRRNKTAEHGWSVLAELAEKYQKTQNQIVLNWMVYLGYRPMVMSINRKHIDENFEAMKFDMVESDYELINSFRSKNYFPPNIDWDGAEIDGDIVTLANEFEKFLRE